MRGYEDEELMVLYLAGNESAFEELFRRYRSRVYGFLSKKISDPRSVEDLFQATFLKLHRSRQYYEPGRIFSAWLFTICRNVVIDHLRKERRGRLFREEQALSAEELAETTPRSDNEQLGEILALVSDKQKEVLQLRYKEELEFDEIAARMNTTPSNVRQMISRALRKFKGTKK